MAATADAGALPSLAVHWVKNNVLAAIVSGVTSLVLYVLRYEIDTNDLDLGAAVAAYGVVVIVVRAFTGAATGVFTGAVLQRIVPLLPARTWVALQAAIFVIFGIIFEVPRIIASIPAGAGKPYLGAILLAQFVTGAILGALVGAVEALVLRKAAFGVVTWIICSSAAYAIGLPFVIGATSLWDVGSGLSGELVVATLNVLSVVIMSLVTLPALRRLKSRQLSTASHHFT
jgi:hypothetical protein